MQKLNYFFLMIASISMFALGSCSNDDDTTIINPVDINFGNASLSVAENAGEQSITINFSQAAPLAGTLTVTTGGTATYNDDYTTNIDGSSGSFDVDIAQGATSATFTFTAIDDSDEENDETITFTLSSSISGLNIGSTGTVTITITDNDRLVLVAVRAEDGQMFSIDTNTGNTSDLLNITLGGSAFLRTRSITYDPNSGLGFIGELSGDDSGSNPGHFYSVDFSTGELSDLNDNSGFSEFYGISGLAFDGTNIIASGYIAGATLITYNTSGSAMTDIDIVGETHRSGGGIVFAGQTGSIYRGSRGAIDLIDLSTGTVSNTTNLSVSDASSFTSANADFVIADARIQNMTENSAGDVYGILWSEDNDSNQYQFLVSIDLTTGMITYIATLQNNGDKTNRIGGLAFVPNIF